MYPRSKSCHILLCLLLCLPCVVPGALLSRLAAETLKNPPLIMTGSQPDAMSAADFNGDGKQDIAYIDGSFPIALHILLGNGDGTFQRGQNIVLPSGFGGGFITVADINGDGHPDILLTGGSQFLGEIAVFRGLGDGTFAAPVISQFTTTNLLFANLKGLGIADFNGDGAPDLVVTDIANSLVFILTGDKSGAFVVKTTLFNNGGPAEVFTGDFNGDGHADFMVHGRLGADVTVYLGKGDGTFQPGVRYTGPDNVAGLLLVDMDGDGHPDIIAAGFHQTISILHGNADGTFATTSSGGATVPLTDFSLVAVADFNGDSIPDLAINSSLGIGILLGQGSLTYGPLVNYVGGGSLFLQAPALADFNSDGHLDFAMSATDGILLLNGNADGTLQTIDSYDLGLPVFSVAIADFNGDGHQDIAVDVSPQPPHVLVGNGLGKFSPGLSPPAGLVAGGFPISIGDFNGDGKPDLLLGVSAVAYGNGDATFAAPIALTGSFIPLNNAAVGDFNKDGMADIISPDSGSLDVFLGQAAKTFLFSRIFIPSISPQPAAPAAGDFNKDGKTDLVYLDISGLQILLGNGDGTFKGGHLLQPGGPPTVADVDGDGNLDVIVLQNFTVTIFYGNGDGTFQPPVSLPLVRNYFQIVVADMNGDGRSDLVLADNQTVAVIHSTGIRSFGPEVHSLAGNIRQITIRDLNADGLPDVVAANGMVSVLPGQAGSATPSGTFTVSPEPSPLGQPFTVQLTLAPSAVTGSVFFSLDGTPLALVPLTSGVATFTLSDSSLFANGPHRLSASYTGGPGFTPAIFPLPHRIVPVIHPTSISLSATPNPVLAGKTVHLSFSVTSSGPTPIGTVAIRDGAVTIGEVFLNSSTGSGVFDTALLGPGSHSISAIYNGDVNSAPATSAPVSVVVNALTTSTSLVSLPANPQAGSTFALSATVTSGSGAPAGAVSFFDGTQLMGVRELDSTGVAVLTATFSGPGTHSYTAAYQANGPFLASTSPAVHLQPVPSTGLPIGTVIFTPQGTDGGPLMFTAQINSGSVPAGAKIAFFSGTSPLGDAVLSSSGMATLEIAGVFPGMHYFTAVYAGSSEVPASSATILAGSQVTSGPDFDVHLSSATAVLGHGHAANVQVSIDPMGGFNDQLNLTCVSSAGIQCSLQPATINGGGSSVITLTAASQNSSVSAIAGPRLLTAAMAGLCVFLCLLFARAGRRVTLAAAFALLAVIAGCGGHSAPIAAVSPTAATVTLVATPAAGTAVSHSVALRVMVDGH